MCLAGAADEDQAMNGVHLANSRAAGGQQQIGKGSIAFDLFEHKGAHDLDGGRRPSLDKRLSMP